MSFGSTVFTPTRLPGTPDLSEYSCLGVMSTFSPTSHTRHLAEGRVLLSMQADSRFSSKAAIPGVLVPVAETSAFTRKEQRTEVAPLAASLTSSD